MDHFLQRPMFSHEDVAAIARLITSDVLTDYEEDYDLFSPQDILDATVEALVLTFHLIADNAVSDMEAFERR
ncbi:MAG: hypothetical protein ACRC14_19270 [Paracoccaceae bacterium]